VKSARITVLATPEFKRFLEAEAKRVGISVGEFIRVRCGEPNEEERLLRDLARQLREDVKKTRASIQAVSAKAERTLAQLRHESRKKDPA
jgi:ribosome recycling factor